MIKETIEEKTLRILNSVLTDEGEEEVIPGEMKYEPLPFDLLKKIVELAIAEERGDCAKLCDDLHYSWRFGEDELHTSGPRECANAIRNRSKL